MSRTRSIELPVFVVSLIVALSPAAFAQQRPAGYDALDEPVPARPAPAVTTAPVSSMAPAAAPTNLSATGASADLGGIEVNADQLEYLSDRKMLIGRGNVVVSRGTENLKADYISVRTDTQDCHAKGHVYFTREGTVWEGEELTYCFKTEQGDFGEFKAFLDPYYVTAKDSTRVSPREFVLYNSTITTCEGTKPEFLMRAREAHVYDRLHLRAKGVVFYFGGVPFFYSPYFKADVNGEGLDFDVVPGYSSLMGFFLLTACNYGITETVSGSTHLDYRTKRGVGVGQDFRWKDTNTASKGEITGYYAQDKKPYKDDKEELKRGGTVEEERYRLRLSDTHNVGERDYVITEVNYLSDKYIIQDFFDQEYRDNVQPENRISLTHPQDDYTAGLLINRRLNDFYENVNREPEATLDFSQQQIGESPFYYQGANKAAFMEKVYPETSTNTDFDAFRVFTDHTISYPKKYFGFFNFIPRAGYKGTYYSKTYEDTAEESLVTETDTNGITTVTTNVQTGIRETGSGFRNIYELGFETSFKAFKVLHNDPTVLEHDVGLRHVIEPYTYYTYIPEPNLLPEDLPQFDEIDTYDKRNDIKLGVRNKMQTKRDGGVHDLVDVDVYSTYRLEPEDGQNDFTDISFDTELRLVHWWQMDFDGTYDTYEEGLKTFNTQLAFFAPDETRLSFEYRHEKDVKDLVTTELDLFPTRKWSLEFYARNEFEAGELEEISGFLIRRSRCMGYGIGAKQVDDENTFWLQIWLLAFPDSQVSLGK